MQRPRTERRKEDAALAKKYNVTDRTIRAWKTAGAPLDSPDAMPRWIMDHQTPGIDRNRDLPHELEHTNGLRYMAEWSAGHFLYESLEVLVPRLVEMLVEDGDMDPKKARGTAMMLWYGMLHQLRHWTLNDRFNLALMEICGQSFDSLMKQLSPHWKERSFPPSKFPKQAVPAAVQEILKASGMGAAPFVEITEGGLRFSTSIEP